MTRRAILVLLSILLVAACGRAVSDDVSTSPDDPVSAPSQPDLDEGPGRELREPEEGLVDIRARPFDRHRARGDELTLFYYSGLDECYGLDRVDAVERENEVILTVFEGRHPEAEVCAEIAVEVRTVVQLERPLGNREVIDGAK